MSSSRYFPKLFPFLVPDSSLESSKPILMRIFLLWSVPIWEYPVHLYLEFSGSASIPATVAGQSPSQAVALFCWFSISSRVVFLEMESINLWPLWSCFVIALAWLCGGFPYRREGVVFAMSPARRVHSHHFLSPRRRVAESGGGFAMLCSKCWILAIVH